MIMMRGVFSLPFLPVDNIKSSNRLLHKHKIMNENDEKSEELYVLVYSNLEK